MDDVTKTRLIFEVDFALAFQGDESNETRQRAETICRRLLERDEWQNVPEGPAGAIAYVERLVEAVYQELGRPLPAAQESSGASIREGWDDAGKGSPIIRRPIT
jgi:hypothetical protein